MSLILRFTLIFLSINLSAQAQFNAEGFEVTKQDIELKVYEKDSTANALIIYETGKSYVDKESYLLKSEIKRKLKILNINGFDKATETVYLYKNDGKKERVKDITATVYNIEDGRITTTLLEDTAIYEEDYNDNYTLIKFTFPNIKAGSVIIYSYTLISPYFFKYNSWYFQDDIPKLYSEYRPSIPGNWEYNIKLVGTEKLHTNESWITKNCLETSSGGSSSCADYLYIMKDLPAFINENYMTTRQNYLARIEYELKVFRSFDGRVDDISKTWKSAEAELRSNVNIGRQLNKSSIIKGLLTEDITNITDPLEKAKAIYEFVQKTYTWNEEFNIFDEVSIKELVKEKSGNVSEINILLHNLLKDNDIDVKPVLLSTRDNGFVTKLYPVISDFNYLIVQAVIGKDTYTLDATDTYLYFGQLPYRCLNQDGRVLDFKDEGYWKDIKSNDINILKYGAQLSIKGSQLTGKIKTYKTGYQALKSKKRYFGKPGNYLDTYINTYPSLQFIEHTAETKLKIDSTFSEIFKIEQTLETIGDKLYFNPFLFVFFDKNPFQLQQRSYPIDFGHKAVFFYSAELTIDDYQVLEIPTSVKISLPNNTGNLIFSSTVKENVVTLYFKFSLDEPVYDASYYDVLKQYFAQIVDIQKNSLVLLQLKR
ncbi:MAG: DUF3857 domain-containing protein [Psychroserpens sp.]|uniref:DUF3857 domain-containing protein n=1 Tax=Psychroserpens sp. TaxID=2020870 RepID=UPI003C731FC2